MAKNGTIGVTTENIFPVIKKFLYSDHEIFLRELVSNAVDATQKLKTLASTGVYNGELGNIDIHISADAEAKTLTVTDRGIGMTAEEVDKYINQIAFSGAEEFLAKYQNQAIIGHFGLGFYSAFMVSDKVEIFTQSYNEEAKSVHWSCNGSPEYEMEELDEKRERGTSIVLHLSEDCVEYCQESKVGDLLRKYCHFLPIPIVFGKVKEWKDGKYVDTEKENVINNVEPLWTRKPADITDVQYKEFYQELYPASDEPLFYIHLNIDYPFHLTGILYFPKIHNNFEIQKNKIQLYSNQVFVTDQVEGIVPEYLTLLHGVIDSPDIPLNVSRSYLQSDANVKKISGYITRKVAERLNELFNTMRAEYEQKWDDLKIFIQYGILTDEKFAEKTASTCMLWKNTDGKYFTPEEYTTAVKENQTDKNNSLILLYVDDAVEKHSFLEAAKAKGYDVLEMNGQLDSHYINWYESKNEGIRFVRVDSDIIEKLIQKQEELKMSLSEAQQELMRPVFESQLPEDEKIHYNISFEAMSADEAPVVITQDEFLRRMKEMAKMSGGGMSQFYGQMPDSFTITVNGNHPIVIDILSEVEKSYGDKLKSITKKIDAAVAEEHRFEEVVKGKKEEELSAEEKTMRTELSEKVVTLRDERNERLREIGKQNSLVRQIIDLALLSNGMLKGKNLSDFIQRSISLIESERK
ncbi:MAG: molecular chaperone HtpG [Alistipes sp.]|nr:molecular chaperone HtpG [Alistipes sp.]